jgi:hypothetical protein
MYFIVEIPKQTPFIINLEDNKGAMSMAKKLADEHNKPVRFYPANPENSVVVNPLTK